MLLKIKLNLTIDEKFAKFGHSFRNDIVHLRNDLKSVKEFNKKNYAKLESVNDIEDGQKFIEKEFEGQKEKIKGLIKGNKKYFRKNIDCIMKSKPYAKVRKKTK